MYFREIELDIVDWIQLAHDLNMVMNFGVLQVPKKKENGEFLVQLSDHQRLKKDSAQLSQLIRHHIYSQALTTNMKCCNRHVTDVLCLNDVLITHKLEKKIKIQQRLNLQIN